jgi:HrpA-like RNA helicase
VAERMNGNTPYTRRTHGTERRGLTAPPDYSRRSSQEQSIADKKRTIELFLQRNAERVADKFNLGNKELPAYRHKQEIVNSVETYKAIILGGETGSGKSTQVPQYLYEAGYDLTIVLVPRRVIADGLGERIREELGAQLPDFNGEEEVGIIHGERSERHPNNKILVMTPNTFSKMEKDLSETMRDDKVAIMSDEIHEANLFTEIATGIAATAVRDKENWRLIAASATHNAQTLESSFGVLNGTEEKPGYVPTVSIEGRPFGIEREEEPELTPMQVYARRGNEHEKSMIFTSGKKEIDHVIEETMKEMESLEKGSSAKIEFRKLHSELSSIELSHINDPVPEGKRIVIVSSPAGMSGITIPGVTMVVSDGTINRQELDDDGNPGLVRHYLSQAEITQQAGRAGRDVDGGIFVLAKPISVMEDKARSRGKTIENEQMEYVPYDERPAHAPPEIYTSVLSRVVLTVAGVDRHFGDINPFIPHRVAESNIITSEDTLFRLGALDDEGDITPVGRVMDQFPITPELSRGLYEFAPRPNEQKQTALQIARAAFTAAAIDVGGLQDFTQKQTTNWRKLVRTETHDDFIAQLDIMTALEKERRNERSILDFTEKFDLSPKRVERAMKVARKILATDIFGRMRLENLVVSPPVVDEETQLRTFFTAGMIDLVHEETGHKSYRKPLYRNIHGNETATERTISDRSILKPQHGQLVAGVPRWYEKRNRDNETTRFNIVESTLLVDPEVVGKYAEANGLLQGNPIAPRIEGDRIIDREQRMFGSIAVGVPVKSAALEKVSEDAQNLLVEHAFKKKGRAQEALRAIADELAWYKERIPADVLEEYRTPDAPSEITQEFVSDLMRQYARHSRSLSELDAKLRDYIRTKNVTIYQYFDEEAREALKRRSPDTIIIGTKESHVFYDHGQPYVKNVSRTQRGAVSGHGPVYLKDGREVLHQIVTSDGSKKMHSFNVPNVED